MPESTLWGPLELGPLIWDTGSPNIALACDPPFPVPSRMWPCPGGAGACSFPLSCPRGPGGSLRPCLQLCEQVGWTCWTGETLEQPDKVGGGAGCFTSQKDSLEGSAPSLSQTLRPTHECTSWPFLPSLFLVALHTCDQGHPMPCGWSCLSGTGHRQIHSHSTTGHEGPLSSFLFSSPPC